MFMVVLMEEQTEVLEDMLHTVEQGVQEEVQVVPVAQVAQVELAEQGEQEALEVLEAQAEQEILMQQDMLFLLKEEHLHQVPQVQQMAKVQVENLLL